MFFILYGSSLNQTKLDQFEAKCGQKFDRFDTWQVISNIVILLKGEYRAEFVEFSHSLNLDIALLDEIEARLSQPGLLIMDMDSTAIQIECIDEIAKLAGTGELVSAITERAMQGELDFEQSLRQRVGTLKNAPENILQQVREKLPLMDGLQETIAELQRHGWKTAIASGGFTYFADYLKDLLKLDYAVSNRFEIIDGVLTGNVLGDVIDAKYKASTLLKLAQKFNIERKNIVAIGDGANDLAMIFEAGVGVAYHAKPIVRAKAPFCVNYADLTALLCILTAKDRLLNN
ncbi:phosphoserine phosphatase [Cricetibacter osteomyelitidis]|uniref:Phosphoserine phosphatase n=1 Tax=Cricetibacter osteomyelitidis TaxID=1521931 RepID=A0A4R2SMK7_9PAST|nr:phosphoserine phosphatase [Cricetibacter osteomyelitidis]